MSRLLQLLLATALAAAACSTDAQSAETAVTTAPTTEAPVVTASPTPEPLPAEIETCERNEPGVSSFSIDAGGADHMVRVFVPAVDDGSSLPLVVNWHGLGSNGPQQAVFTNYESLADDEEFIVAHPTGVPVAGDTRNSWELDQFDDPERDDLALAEALIDRMIDEFCVDPKRIYSTGMSNGGFFTSRLVCELSDRIAAAVSVAGLTHHDGCSPERAVPFMAFHGTADQVVPYAGGESTLTADAAEQGVGDFFDQVMPVEFAQFAESSGCDPDPATSTVSGEVIRFDYGNCNDDAELVFFEIANGGHTWPGSPIGPLLTDALGYTTFDVRATEDGWAFMQRFSLP